MIGSLQRKKMSGQNSRPTPPHGTHYKCNSQPRLLSRLNAHPGMNAACVNLVEGFSEYIVRVAMYFRSNFVESCNQIHFWKADTSLKPKTNVSI